MGPAVDAAGPLLRGIGLRVGGAAATCGRGVIALITRTPKPATRMKRPKAERLEIKTPIMMKVLRIGSRI
jgi:hypothetical protein